MALLTLEQYYAAVGLTTTDATRDASIQSWIVEANDAVLRYLKNGQIELTSYTVILDAPVSTNLVLPIVPVLASSLVIYLNLNAQGDPAAFTAGTLLVPYRDYVLDTGPNDITYSNTGIVRNLSAAWGVWYQRQPLSLAPQLIPAPKAIKATFTAGYPTVPPSIQAAMVLIVSRLYNMRKIGYPLVSESLQSYSYSAQSTASADGIIQGDPTVRSLLKPFGRQIFVGTYN